MSPTELAAGSQSFGVRRGNLERLDPHFHSPIFRALMTRIVARPHMPLGRIVGQSAEMWDREATLEIGIDNFCYLEISAVGLGTNEYTVESIPIADAPSRARMVLRGGDIVVSTTRPHRGAIAEINASDDGVIGSTGFVVLREHRASSVRRDFLLNVLLSDSVLTQFLQRSSGGAYPAITADQIDRVLIPTPDPITQQRLVNALNDARSARRRKVQEANDLLTGLDSVVLDALGLTAPAPHDPNKPFAVHLGALRGNRLDPPAYTPFPVPSNPQHIPIEPLAKIAAIDANAAPRMVDRHAIVPYVGLPECDLNNVREVVTREYAEVKGRSVAHVGDILFARIEPSIFNKKYVLVEHLGGYDYSYLSTEFYPVRAHGDAHDQLYLFAMFQSSFVFNQLRGKTTGSSGRRRLDPDMFARLLIPWPDRDRRKRIAAELLHRRQKAHLLCDEAARLWEDAKNLFEEELLGPEIAANRPEAVPPREETSS